MKTTEDEWLYFLKSKPHWTVPTENIIILSPHPDDETLGAGGLIYNLRKHNQSVKIIAITDGENAYPKMNTLRAIRQKEQEDALSLLGLSAENIIRLRLEDSGLSKQKARLKNLLEPYFTPNNHIIAPWINDYHADHEITGQVAQRLAQDNKTSLSFYFFWTWHHATIKDLKPYTLKLYCLEQRTQERKLQALACYDSQYYYDQGNAILSTEQLAPAYRPFEVFYTDEH